VNLRILGIRRETGHKAEKEQATHVKKGGAILALLSSNSSSLSARDMIEVEYGEFRGDRQALANYLRERLKTEVRLERKAFRIGSSVALGPGPNAQQVKDLVKRALHHIGADGYHVVTLEGVLSIRERKTREHYAKKRGSAPSVRQTVPYFFPG